MSRGTGPVTCYCGVQTVESMKIFNIRLPTGKENHLLNQSFEKFALDRMPAPIIKAYALFKKFYARVNKHYGLDGPWPNNTASIRS